MKNSQKSLSNQLTGREKLAFGLANLGNIPVMMLIGSFLLMFYTDVVGLNPAAVATLFLITRFIDGINDPVMGFVIDHLPKTKLGRFRTYLLIGAIVCSINYILLWFGPLWAPAGKLVIAYITYMLIGITFDLMDIPLNSLIPVMTDEEKERTSLSTIKGVFLALGGILIGIIAPLIISNASSLVNAYYILIFGAVLIVFICSVIGVMGVRERILPSEHNEKYGIKDIFSILSLGPVIFAFVPALLNGIGGAISSSSNLFFYRYVLGNIEIMSLVGFTALFGLIPAMVLSGLIVKKIEKKWTFTLGLFVSGLAPLLRLISITNVPLLIVSSILSGIGGGLIATVTYSVQADNVDYVEYKRNYRAEGCVASLNSFVAKAGQGLGGAIPGYVLAATGYVKNAAQSEKALSGIVMNATILPGACLLLAALLFGVGYKLNREKVNEITQELRARRAK